ncbi:MAG: hypothetical protein ABIP20_19725, partial [Chthoniobacteraceae bacterium]
RFAPAHPSGVPIFHPSSFDLHPFRDVPFHIQKLVIVEGEAPKGGMRVRQLTGQGPVRMRPQRLRLGQIPPLPCKPIVNDLVHLHEKNSAEQED